MKLSKNLSLLILCLFSGLIIYSQTNVVYGDQSYYENNSQVTRVFIDNGGNFYPNLSISDDSLQMYHGNIKIMYLNNQQYFIDHASKLGLKLSTFSPDNFKIFQDTIVHRITKKIAFKTDKNSHLYSFIHGFRKPKTPMGGSHTAKQDYAYERSLINKATIDSTKNHFLEIYWDGTYDCCFGKRIKKNNEIYNLFEFESQINAVHTGYGLRKLISKLQVSEISFFSHSLGAKVLTSLLFNCHDNEATQFDNNFATPHQKINAYLVAPAISDEPFNEYQERNLEFINNYNIYILHNKKDFVLRKRILHIGPGPNKRGKTTLGCNYKKEADKLCSRMGNYFHSVDLSKTGNSHHVTSYLNQEVISQLLNKDQ